MFLEALLSKVAANEVSKIFDKLVTKEKSRDELYKNLQEVLLYNLEYSYTDLIKMREITINVIKYLQEQADRVGVSINPIKWGINAFYEKKCDEWKLLLFDLQIHINEKLLKEINTLYGNLQYHSLFLSGCKDIEMILSLNKGDFIDFVSILNYIKIDTIYKRESQKAFMDMNILLEKRVPEIPRPDNLLTVSDEKFYEYAKFRYVPYFTYMEMLFE